MALYMITIVIVKARGIIHIAFRVHALSNVIKMLATPHPDTWFDFLDAFNQRFLDTHRDTKARMEIENLKMKDNNVDEYDQRFRALAREAHYDLREISVLMKFLKGLPRSITQECIRTPRPNNYTGLVQRA